MTKDTTEEKMITGNLGKQDVALLPKDSVSSRTKKRKPLSSPEPVEEVCTDRTDVPELEQLS